MTLYTQHLLKLLSMRRTWIQTASRYRRSIYNSYFLSPGCYLQLNQLNNILGTNLAQGFLLLKLSIWVQLNSQYPLGQDFTVLVTV